MSLQVVFDTAGNVTGQTKNIKALKGGGLFFSGLKGKDVNLNSG